MLGLYAELYALALHIYVHGDPGNNVGPRDPQLGHLLYKRPVETSERSIMEQTVFSMVGKRISRRRQDQWKLTLTQVLHLTENTDEDHRVIDVLKLIVAEEDEIFPRYLELKSPPWVDKTVEPDKTIELFGPLVQMMKEMVHSNEEVRHKLVRQAHSRGLHHERIARVARLATHWREWAKKKRTAADSNVAVIVAAAADEESGPLSVEARMVDHAASFLSRALPRLEHPSSRGYKEVSSGYLPFPG